MGLQLVFTRRYSMAHRLIAGCSEKCATPHGHNEFVTVELEPIYHQRLDQNVNMVGEFAAVKQRWHYWIDTAVDHALQLSDKDPLVKWFADNEPNRLRHLLITPGDPTTEMLAVVFMAKITAFLKQDQLDLRCTRIEIEETPTNKVILTEEHIAWGKHLPTDHHPIEYWWNRSDNTINDLF